MPQAHQITSTTQEDGGNGGNGGGNGDGDGEIGQEAILLALTAGGVLAGIGVRQATQDGQ